MGSTLKPIKLYGASGPNPPRVQIILEELGLPHNIVDINITEVKKPEYLAINPNGRLPAIHDPNTNITLWESGAILEYLVERYDTEHLISFPQGSPESYHTKQWAFYQTSGQGPYFGQVAWFMKFHPEKVPSAVSRYVAEVNRVDSVLESWLIQQEGDYGSDGGGPWLVSNKMSYADLAFIPWELVMQFFIDKKDHDLADYPHVKDWMDRMTKRPGVQKGLESFDRMRKKAAQG